MRKELQAWVKEQRAQRKLFDRPGTKSHMTEGRIEALDDIHFTWAPQGRKPKVSKKRKR